VARHADVRGEILLEECGRGRQPGYAPVAADAGAVFQYVACAANSLCSARGYTPPPLLPSPPSGELMSEAPAGVDRAELMRWCAASEELAGVGGCAVDLRAGQRAAGEGTGVAG
jgi:hypothetical protein